MSTPVLAGKEVHNLAVVAATTAVMTPGWAGPRDRAGTASGTSSGQSSRSSSTTVNSGMGDAAATNAAVRAVLAEQG